MRLMERARFALLSVALTAPSAFAQERPSETPAEVESNSPPPDESPELSPNDSQGPSSPISPLTPPELLKDVQPNFPAQARAEGIGAVVIVTLDLDETGHVEEASIERGAEATGYGFDEAALQAARQLVFSPARENGQPIPVRISYRFRFEPQAEAEPPPEELLEKPTAPVPTQSPGPEAPVGELRGVLLERGTRLPLAGVRVTVFRGEGQDAEGFETETNARGEFLFENLSVGQWRLLAEPEGYFPVRQTEQVVANQRVSLKYRIEKQSYNPYDVLVETDGVRREVTHTKMDAKRAERIPGTFGDVLAVVQNFPGVALADLNQLVVRGSAPEDSRILINKTGMPLVYHFGGLRSVMPVGMLDSIEFYPGNYSVEFGRATGGVVDVKLKKLAPKKIGGYGDFNLFDTSLYLEVPVSDEFAFALSGRRSYIDALISAVAGQGGGQIVAPRYFDAHALASYRPSEAHHLEAFFIVSGDKFKAIFEEPLVSGDATVTSDIGYGVDFYRAMLNYDFVPSKRISNEFKGSFGRDDIGYNVGEAERVEYAQYQVQIRDTARFELARWLALRGGVDYQYLHLDYNARAPGLTFEGDFQANQETDDFFEGTSSEDLVFSKLKADTHSVAGFLEMELRPYESLLLLPGARVDYFTRTEKLGISPRFVAEQRLTDHWSVSAGVGLFLQEPQIIETDPSFGSADLGLEEAMHYSLGTRYTPTEYLNLEVTGFYKTMDNLVTRAAPTDDPAAPSLNNGGTGRVYGVEVSAKHELFNNFYGFLAYTLSRAERKDDQADEYRLFDFDQTHILTVVGAYQLPHNWEISSRFRFVSGQLYTPVAGAVYDIDNGSYQAIPGDTNSDRLAPFRQLDLRIDKRWIYKNYIFSAYLDIQNVTNQKHQRGISYNTDYTETESTPGLPILPILGLRGEF